MSRKHPLIPTHDDIDKVITEWLDLYRICWHYVPNKGRYDGGQDKKTPGAPDIVICVNGLYVAVEFKTHADSQTPEQKEIQARVESPGAEGIYIIARDLEDVTDIISKIQEVRDEIV